MENFVVRKLQEKGWHIAFAESCTGGLAAARLVNVADASRVLDASFVTYAAGAKTELVNVQVQTIDCFGVVSEEVAREMAEGAASRCSAQVGVGITGFAGPGGGTEKAPVGTVCFGIFVDGSCHSFTQRFADMERNEVRSAAVDFVYEKLVQLLKMA